MLIGEYKHRFPQAIATMEEGLEDALQYLSYAAFDHRKISSTNILERLNREIRRRSRVVGIFPSMDSYLRLITTYLIEYGEDWSTGKCYIKQLLIEEQRLALQQAA
ncbi:MAG: transposase [Deltaproteobacteria bacterium]|nr:transposase [Deltaproteobacteria bacterium]